jgi:hypothetical protein
MQQKINRRMVTAALLTVAQIWNSPSAHHKNHIMECYRKIKIKAITAAYNMNASHIYNSNVE